ncbi:MAG: 2-succinyl-5-enolpyruvyl-6-hydroxy-3-cyclohexene-1-carboxylic-acid synthase [Reichenbachiella sp.]
MGIKNAVISPGSRNAALTIAFARHPHIKCLSIPDERSAAFIALGMSLQNDLPTVLICTSGSAGLNYAPAIAEAYFNRIPLLVLTADRPEEMIDIRDGQTIFQKQLYGKHVKAYFNYASQEIDIEKLHRVIVEAISNSLLPPFGPVHVNIPFSEPFYPEKDFDYQYSTDLDLIKKPSFELKNDPFPTEISSFKKILFVVGQQKQNIKLLEFFNQISSRLNIPIIADVISNTHNIEGIIRHHDFFLGKNSPDLAPDLIITIGLSVLSKKLKNLLRKSSNAKHWHISESNDSADTFGKLSKSIQSSTIDFLNIWLSLDQSASETQSDYHNAWNQLEKRAIHIKEHIDLLAYTDASVYQSVLASLPNGIDLHLANSMAVRYVNLFGIKNKSDVNIFCNRGTSGIDGSNSTAVGSALSSKKETLLLTGDLAFLYDRNAFWHNHLSYNLKIIIINNGGGGIFRLIQGPSEQPELEKYFETDQKSNGSHVAKEFDFSYEACHNQEEFRHALSGFFDSDKRMILEVFTDKTKNQQAFKELFDKFN